jgi:translation initiation factor IF-1
MAEEIIDFGNFSKRINVSPIIPLQILNLKCRNGNRIQATILGKVYSSHIDILEIVPVAICEENKVMPVVLRLNPSILLNISAVSTILQASSPTCRSLVLPSLIWLLIET